LISALLINNADNDNLLKEREEIILTLRDDLEQTKKEMKEQAQKEAKEYRDQIAELKWDHDYEKDDLKIENQMRLALKEHSLQINIATTMKDKNIEIGKLKKRNAKELHKAKEEYLQEKAKNDALEEQIKTLKLKTEANLGEKVDFYTRKIKQMFKDHEGQIKEMKEQISKL